MDAKNVDLLENVKFLFTIDIAGSFSKAESSKAGSHNSNTMDCFSLTNRSFVILRKRIYSEGPLTVTR